MAHTQEGPPDQYFLSFIDGIIGTDFAGQLKVTSKCINERLCDVIRHTCKAIGTDEAYAVAKLAEHMVFRENDNSKYKGKEKLTNFHIGFRHLKNQINQAGLSKEMCEKLLSVVFQDWLESSLFEVQK